MINSQQVDRPYRHQMSSSLSVTRSATVRMADPAIDLDDLVDGLKALRKGRGLFVTNIAERVRPALCEICGITDQDGPAEIRGKVARRLENLACTLPADLRVAAMAAFAITQEARLPLYQDRVEWTAARINRDPRTARRRIDDAIHQLAQQATAQPQLQGQADTTLSPPWHTSEMRMVLTLDGEYPQAIERRRVVADRDEVTKLDFANAGDLSGAVSDGPGIAVSLLFGGIWLDTGTGRAHVLHLPRMLHRGEAHEYGLRHQVPGGEVRQTRIVCVPSARFDHFELRIRFGREHQPHRIWLLDNPPHGMADAIVPARELLADAAGEVCLTFDDLVPGCAYGARWVWAAELQKPKGSAFGPIT